MFDVFSWFLFLFCFQVVFKKAEKLFAKLARAVAPFGDWVALGTVELTPYLENGLKGVGGSCDGCVCDCDCMHCMEIPVGIWGLFLTFVHIFCDCMRCMAISVGFCGVVAD